jgi:dolichol kinase
MREMKRQLWHAMFGVLVAVLIMFTPPVFFQSLMIVLLLALYYIRVLVQRGYTVPIVNDFFKAFGRKNDVGDGSFYFIFGALIASLFFEPIVAAVSVLVLGVSDAVATIVGVNWGYYKLYKGKTFEGSTAFFISSYLTVYYFYGFWPALISALVLTPVELLGGFNDNIVIPPLCSVMIVLSQMLV